MAKIRQAIEEFVPDQRLVDERGATNQRKQKAADQVFIDPLGREHMRDSPINVLLGRKRITNKQYEAAQKFKIHWYEGGMAGILKSPDVARIFGGFSPSDGLARGEKQPHHREQFAKAIRALGDKSWIAVNTVLYEMPLVDAGVELGYKNRPQASAVAHSWLTSQLDILGKLWGIV